MAKKYFEPSLEVKELPECDAVLASKLDTVFVFTEAWFGASEGGIDND